jgi:hypothetical protein
MMGSSPFLQVPNTVREQIYAELLTYPAAACAGEDVQASAAPASPIGQILTLNRAIHNEVIDFLEHQLCVLIKTNNQVLMKAMLAQTGDSRPVPILSQLRSKNAIVSKNASQAPIAMELDLFIYEKDLPAESYDAFLMPASSMHAVLEKLSQPNWITWCMRASISFTLLHTFSHTEEKALERLVQPWLSSFVPPYFLGIGTSCPIPNLQLRERLQVRSSFSRNKQVRKPRVGSNITAIRHGYQVREAIVALSCRLSSRVSQPCVHIRQGIYLMGEDPWAWC